MLSKKKRVKVSFLLFASAKSKQKNSQAESYKTPSQRTFLQLAALKQVKMFFRLEAFYKQDKSLHKQLQQNIHTKNSPKESFGEF